MPTRPEHAPPTQRASGRGFTLAELLVVLAIIGLLTAVAAPRWGAAMSQRQANMAVYRIAEDARQAAAMARAKGSATRLAMGTPYSHYWWDRGDNTAAGEAPGWTDLSVEPWNIDYLAILAETAPPEVWFEADGSIRTNAVIAVARRNRSAGVILDESINSISVAVSRNEWWDFAMSNGLTPITMVFGVEYTVDELRELTNDARRAAAED